MISIDFSSISLQLKQQDGKTLVFDPVRKKWLILTPEEHVRQYTAGYLIHIFNYPSRMMAIEKKITNGNIVKRYDIVVYDRDHKPWMLIECKSPEVNVTQSTLYQLLQYQNTMQCRYWVLTNGRQTFCADASNIQHVQWINELPPYNL